MQNNTAYKFAPVITEDKKVDVTLTGGEAEIKLSTWVENLGWCCQKTMSVDAEMLDELHRVITAARIKLRRDRDEESDEILSAKILEFPVSA